MKKRNQGRAHAAIFGAAPTVIVAGLLLAAPRPATAEELQRIAGAPGETEAAEESPAPAAVSTETETETESEPGRLRIRLGGTGAIVDGDVAQFQQRNQIPEGISGGIEEFHYEKEIAEDTELELDGRAIFDNRDYLLRLQIQNEDKGFLDLGYRQFRTWYDARGGYFPPSDIEFDVIDPETGVDRGEAWAKGGLLLPEGFRLNLGYRYLSRSGSKSSIEWGDSTALGLAPPNNRRDIVPAFYEIDEQRHQVDIELARTTEKSEIGAGILYERSDIDNKRNVTRSPGQAGLERRFTQRDDSNSHMIVARAFGSRRLWEDKVTVSGAYAYNDLDLDLGGSRIYGSTFHPSFSLTSPNRQQRDEGFFDLSGSTRMREHVGNVSLSARPVETVQVLSALRMRGESRHGYADFVETNVGAAPDFVTALEDLETLSDTDDVSFAEDIEVRFTGIDNVVLYAAGQWEESNGDFYESIVEPLVPVVVDLERRTDVDRLIQKYAAGAKVYPARWIHFSGEYAYRLSDYDYTHRTDSTPNDLVSGDRYPAFLVDQSFATHDFNVRTTLRLPADVGVVLRYDWLRTTIETEGDQLSEIESAEVRSHIMSATVTWNPVAWWWTRTGVNYVISTTDTSANNYVTPVSDLFRSFDNDYLLTTLSSGVALDDSTQLELGYNWISADNYRDISAQGVPFGSRFDEHAVGFRLAHRLSEHTKIAGGYSYINNDEAFAGGNYNYDAHLITTSVEFEY